MQVNRVYHLRVRDHGSRYAPVQAKGGATVLVSGEQGSNQVSVKVAFCRPDTWDHKAKEVTKGDSYNKKLGRKYAEGAQERIIPLRSLPGFLGQTYREVHRRAHIKVLPHYTDELPRFDNRIFDFLPKELV